MFNYTFESTMDERDCGYCDDFCKLRCTIDEECPYTAGMNDSYIGAAVMYFIGGDTVNGYIGLALAALFSPYGLPMLAIMLLGVVQKVRYAIQDRVYG